MNVNVNRLIVTDKFKYIYFKCSCFLVAERVKCYH